MRTSIHLPDELLASAKLKAAKEGRTLTSLIEEGLRLVMSSKPTPKVRRKLPRISTKKGGLMPGIDLTRMSDIQEREDLEYVDRLRKGFK